MGEKTEGKHAVVLGRSNLVGKPVAQLLLNENCTVTIAHSKTRDLPAMCRSADILVAAVGRAEMVKKDWVKPGAVVIDVGTTRIAAPERGEGKMRLAGDVAFAEAKEVAGAITPVPGGVGPMTIACLLRNTVHCGIGPGRPAAACGLRTDALISVGLRASAVYGGSILPGAVAGSCVFGFGSRVTCSTGISMNTAPSNRHGAGHQGMGRAALARTGLAAMPDCPPRCSAPAEKRAASVSVPAQSGGGTGPDRGGGRQSFTRPVLFAVMTAMKPR